MKVAFGGKEVDKSEVLLSEKFSIGNVPMIIGFLRNNIYSNKIRVICQEYMCNGRDAHREVGKDNVPIHVYAPTIEDQTLEIRDFGPGVSPDRMENIFCKFGSSTKTQSNDQTGGFGLGAKSAWSYTDQFSVVTFIDGTKRYYSMSLDETQCGEMNLLAEEPTTEENGTLVSVPIALKDISKFGEWIVYSCAHWDVRPVIHRLNANIKWPSDKSIITKSEHGHWVLRNTTAEYDGDVEEAAKSNGKTIDISTGRTPGANATGCSVIVDGVFYPLDSAVVIQEAEKAKYANQGNIQTFIQKFNCFLYFKTGQVDVSISRESLQYNQKTSNAIIKRIENALYEMTKNVRDDVESQPNMLLAMKALASYNNIVLSLVKGIKWKGKTVDSHISCTEAMKIVLIAEDSSKACGYTTQTVANTMFRKENDAYHYNYNAEKSKIKNDIILVVNDVPDEKRPNVARMRTIFDNKKTDEDIFVITTNFTDYESWKDAHDEFLSDLKTHNISAYEPIYLSKVEKKKAAKRVVARDGNVKFNIYEIDEHQCSIQKRNVAMKDFDGYYIELEGQHLYLFDKQICHRDSSTHNWHYINTCKKFLGCKKLYAIPRRLLSSVVGNSKLTKLEAGIFNKLDEMMKTAEGKELFDRVLANTYCGVIEGKLSDIHKIQSVMEKFKITAADIENKNSKMRNYLETFFITDENADKVPIYKMFLGNDILYKKYQTKERKAIIDDVEKTYEMIKYLDTWCSDSDKPDRKKTIIRYVETVDKVK